MQETQTTRPSKRQAAADRRKAELLEVGATVLAEQSYDSAWTDEVSRRAGISKTLIYHHFGNKRRFYIEILRYLVQRLNAEWQQSAMPLIQKAATPKEVLQAGLRAFLDQALHYPEAYRTTIRAGQGLDAEITTLYDDVHERAISLIALFFQLKTVPPMFRLACKAWLTFVASVTMSWLDDPELNRDELIEIMRATLHTLLPLKNGTPIVALQPVALELPKGS